MGRRVLVLVAVLGLLVALLPALGGAAEPDRVAGPSRFATAVKIAQRSFPDGADVAYLARADQFADALAAGTLTDGPTLLVPSCGDLPGEVVDEIARLDPDSVIALGGVQAVCDELLATAATGRSADRISGVSRFDTAAAIATRAFGDGAEVVYVANAADSPDAIAGGALVDGPILLVPADGDPPPIVTQTLATLDPETVIALGGSQAVADTTLAAAAGGRTTDRLSGASRFDTAAAIAGRAFPTDTGVATVYLARGDVFADAVASGSLTDGPVLLVGSCGPLPDAAVDYLTAAQADTVIALGGTQAVCDQVLTDAATIGTGGTPTPPPTPTPTPTDPTPTPSPTVTATPTPTPPPTPPDGELTGTLYYESIDFISYDFATGLETSRAEANGLTPDGSQILEIGENDDGGSVANWRDTVTDEQIDSTPLPVNVDDVLDAAEASPNGEFVSFEVLDLDAGDGSNLVGVVDRAGNDALDDDPDSLAAIRGIGDGDGSSHVWSAQGELYFTFKPEGEETPVLARLDPALRDLEVIREFPTFDYDSLPLDLAVSPDGSQMVYTYLGHLYRLDIATGEQVQLTTSDESENKGGFSPDGSQIVFSLVSTSSPGTIYVIPNGEYPEPTRIERHVDGSDVPADAPYTLVVDSDDSSVSASGHHIYWFPTP